MTTLARHALFLFAASTASTVLLASACSEDSSPPVAPLDASGGLDATRADAPATSDVVVADSAPADAAVLDVTVPDAAPDAAPDAVVDASSDAATDGGADANDGAVASYDVTADYSSTSNPTGPWTYGYTTAFPAADAGVTLVVFPNGGASWSDPNNVNLGAPTVWRNDTGAAVSGVAPGEVSLHPGNLGEYAVVRWTAPASGTFQVHLEFKDGDTGDTDGYLLHNGVTIASETTTSTAGAHDVNVVVAAGDRLDVAVGPKGSFFFDNTPIVFTITP